MSIQNYESVTYHPAVIWSLGHLVKMISELSKSSTIYKYLIFIYSEQMTHPENENDHFDLDHFDHNLPHPSSSHIALMFLLCYSYLKWELYGICIGFTQDLLRRGNKHGIVLYLRKREKKNPILSRIYKTIWEMGILRLPMAN